MSEGGSVHRCGGCGKSVEVPMGLGVLLTCKDCELRMVNVGAADDGRAPDRDDDSFQAAEHTLAEIFSKHPDETDALYTTDSEHGGDR